jgi:hypothetical protein
MNYQHLIHDLESTELNTEILRGCQKLMCGGVVMEILGSIL